MKIPYETLLRDNPMRIEIARFRRRFLGFGASSLTNVVLALVGLCYVGIVMLVIDTHGELPPLALVEFQTALFCFFGPAMLHGSVAGERERRSWDLLLVAPISKAQIVAGKFMGALAALGVGAAAMGLPILIAAATYHKTSAYDLALGEGVSLAFCTLVCAWTIALSAWAKRPIAAFGMVLGTLAVGLVAVPMLLMSLSHGNRFVDELTSFPNPFSAIYTVMDPGHLSVDARGRVAQPWIYGVPQLVAYLGATAALLVFTAQTLTHADNRHDS